MNTEKPIKKDEYHEVEIEGLGHEGEGVGRVNDFTVFVPYALPGDRVKAKIIKVKNTYSYARIVNIIEPSKYRIDPACTVFFKCGGCQLQHLDYAQQLVLKRQLVIDNLERIGKFDNIKVNKTIGMETPMRYRNKMQLPVGNSRTGSINIGFYAHKTHDIIETDTCYIQPHINEEIIRIIRQWMEEKKITAYDEQTGKGLIRHIYTRIGFKTEEIMVVLVTNRRKIPNIKDLINTLTKINKNIVSIVQNINLEKSNVILGKENILLWGKDTITDFIGDIKFNISPISFYQINPLQTEILYNKVTEYAQLTGEETVFDLYCGIGTISLFLAQKAKKVIGVEIIPQAITDAKHTAKINNINNVEFYAGAVEETIPHLYKKGYMADVVVVDPPRKGCDEELLKTIIDMKVGRIVYVSCNPSTLARDLRILADNSYQIKEIQPVDMFPHTSHVECVVLMSRVEK